MPPRDPRTSQAAAPRTAEAIAPVRLAVAQTTVPEDPTDPGRCARAARRSGSSCTRLPPPGDGWPSSPRGRSPTRASTSCPQPGRARWPRPTGPGSTGTCGGGRAGRCPGRPARHLDGVRVAAPPHPAQPPAQLPVRRHPRGAPAHPLRSQGQHACRTPDGRLQVSEYRPRR